MNHNTRAVGWKNGGPGVLPCAVEAKPAPTFLRGRFLMLLSIFIVFYRSSWSQRKGASALFTFSSRKKWISPRGYERETNNKKAHAAHALIFLSFEGQKKQKPFFSSKAAGANQPHTKTKSARAAFYWNVNQCPFPNAQGLLSPFV